MGMIMTRIINQKPVKRAYSKRPIYHVKKRERSKIATVIADIFYWINTVIYAVISLTIVCGIPAVCIYFLIKWIFF